MIIYIYIYLQYLFHISDCVFKFLNSCQASPGCPAALDFCLQCGNSAELWRQGCVYITRYLQVIIFVIRFRFRLLCSLTDGCQPRREYRKKTNSTHGQLSTEPLRNYKVQSTGGQKQWYLLSLFIGDAVRDVPLCKHLAKRMPCPGTGPLPPPQPR